MTRIRRRPALLVPLLLLALIGAAACATTLRDNVRKSAVVAGEVALSIDQTEQELWAAHPPGYTAEKHQQVNDAMILMLASVRAYERAARAWPEAMPMPTTVPQAMMDALAAIATVERIIEGIPGNEKLKANLARVRATIGGTK